MLDRILIVFRRTWIAKLIWGRKRSNPKVQKTKKKESNSFRNSLKNIKNFLFNNTAKKFTCGIIGGLILLTFFVHFSKYLSINTKPFFEDEQHTSPKLQDLKEFNVLLLIIDDNTKDYYFIDSVSLINANFNTKKTNIYTINPNFMIKTDDGVESSIKSYLNLFNASNEDKIGKLTVSIENLLGIRVDRYIAISSKNLQNFIDYENISIKSEQDLEIADQDIKADKTIKSDILKDILFDQKIREGNNNQVALLNSYFVKELISFHFGFFDLYKYFWNSGELTNSFRTDMSKKEFITFISNLRELDKPIKTAYLSTDLGVKVADSIEEIYKPDFTLIDESITNLLSNIGLISEQAEVEIYNSTSISGLASKKRRELENLGINIVKYGNYFEHKDKNYLYVVDENPEKYKNTIDAIDRAFRGDVEVVIGEYEDNYTGDLILILGGE